jgi:glycosyltransferase involved in cell wall biosynthesis
MRFIVAQTGARRGYVVPSILENAGMLERFYTDITGDIGLGAFLCSAVPLPFIGEAARRLAGRRLSPNVRAKTTTFPGISLVHALRQAAIGRDPAAAFREAIWFSNALGRAMTRRGFGDATHIYSMLGECAPFLIAAKERGLTVISEIYIPLSAERILAEERRKFPDWEPDAPDFAAIRREIGDEDALLTHSDFALCPFEAVRDDLVQNFRFPSERTAVVPFATDQEFLSMHNEPVRGRILFAGTAELRKGIHYFAMAAEKLFERGLRYEFRVAGNVQKSVADQAQCRYLTFLGRLLRADMLREFAVADVCVLPSLAEASAGVTYESLACGVPLVTTYEVGSVMRDGVEGRMVPSRDPEALANAIVEIVEDRRKRERMSHAARERARDFTWEHYGERLVGALKSFAAPQAQSFSA